MNIFYLSQNPQKAAQEHNDKHVVKMILESAQLLCGAHHVLDANQNAQLYKLTHKNHPSAIWVRSSINNYKWLYQLFCALCDEYTFRYNKKHLTDVKLREFLKMPPMNISSEDFSPPPLAMPVKYHQSDAVAAYREYYRSGKNHLASWSRRGMPNWYME